MSWIWRDPSWPFVPLRVWRVKQGVLLLFKNGGDLMRLSYSSSLGAEVLRWPVYMQSEMDVGALKRKNGGDVNDVDFAHRSVGSSQIASWWLVKAPKPNPGGCSPKTGREARKEGPTVCRCCWASTARQRRPRIQSSTCCSQQLFAPPRRAGSPARSAVWRRGEARRGWLLTSSAHIADP
jgi:hypothetical protein